VWKGVPGGFGRSGRIFDTVTSSSIVYQFVRYDQKNHGARDSNEACKVYHKLFAAIAVTAALSEFPVADKVLAGLRRLG
jgi:hypothetical protein